MAVVVPAKSHKKTILLHAHNTGNISQILLTEPHIFVHDFQPLFRLFQLLAVATPSRSLLTPSTKQDRSEQLIQPAEFSINRTKLPPLYSACSNRRHRRPPGIISRSASAAGSYSDRTADCPSCEPGCPPG